MARKSEVIPEPSLLICPRCAQDKKVAQLNVFDADVKDLGNQWWISYKAECGVCESFFAVGPIVIRQETPANVTQVLKLGQRVNQTNAELEKTRMLESAGLEEVEA